MSPPTPTRDLTRRQAMASGLVAMWAGLPSSAVELKAQVPTIPFARNRTGDGYVGPYGEVRTAMADGARVPVQILAAGGLAAIDLTQPRPWVRIGAADKSAVVLTSTGIRFGSDARAAPWSRDSIVGLTAALERDLTKARGVMLLRSTLHSTYPIAVKELKGSVPEPLAMTLSKGARGLGSLLPAPCGTEGVTEEAVTKIMAHVEVWKSAERRYQACVSREMARDPCQAFGPGAPACAIPICTALGFVDMLVAVIEVVTTIVEGVVRTVITCGELTKRFFASRWDLPGIPLNRGFLVEPAQRFSRQDIAVATELLRDLSGLEGPIAKCLLSSDWSLAQLETPIQIGDGNVVVPYGVRACISAKCARMLAATNVAGEVTQSWIGMLETLAAMNPRFSTYAAASLGIYASPVAITAVAAAGGPGAVGVQCAAILLAFIILVLIYGTAISAQLAFHDAFTDNLSDGFVCIEHPSFVLSMIKFASLTLLPAELVPPIVTG